MGQGAVAASPGSRGSSQAAVGAIHFSAGSVQHRAVCLHRSRASHGHLTQREVSSAVSFPKLRSGMLQSIFILPTRSAEKVSQQKDTKSSVSLPCSHSAVCSEYFIEQLGNLRLQAQRKSGAIEEMWIWSCSLGFQISILTTKLHCILVTVKMDGPWGTIYGGNRLQNRMEARKENEDPLYGPSDLSNSRHSTSGNKAKEVSSIFLSHSLLRRHLLPYHISWFLTSCPHAQLMSWHWGWHTFGITGKALKIKED